MSAQVIPQEILTILAQKGQFRSNGVRSTFPESANKLIEEIRKEIPSGQDGDGWHTVGANWRSNVKTSNFMPTMKTTEWDRSKCKELYDSLYKYYEELQEDDAVKDTIIANDYEFDEDGNIL